MAKTNSIHTKDKQEVKAITDQLEEGLKELFESRKYKSYLSMMSKFHNYSADNIQLITMQCPGACLKNHSPGLHAPLRGLQDGTY